MLFLLHLVPVTSGTFNLPISLALEMVCDINSGSVASLILDTTTTNANKIHLTKQKKQDKGHSDIYEL